MSIEGIWTGEIDTPYGWENSGVYVLDRGVIVGGSNRHYSSGHYSVDGSTYKAKIAVHYYGPPRTIFGEKQERFEVEVSGEIEGDEINGQLVRPEKREFSVRYRMTKRIDIPEPAT